MLTFINRITSKAMPVKKIIFLAILVFQVLNLSGQRSLFGLELALKSNRELIPTALPYEVVNLSTLNRDHIAIKYITQDYIYFNLTKSQLIEIKDKTEYANLYFEFAPPVMLDDTARFFHSVNQVHTGTFPLQTSYTGRDVIIGIVDNQIDYTHPDFIDSNGNNRVLAYWDHSIVNPNNPPYPYNYGEFWTNQDIMNMQPNNLNTTNEHGTTVMGIAAGNGLGNGRNKGIAPDCDIVIVETDFDLPNWTLSIADACDFIFSIADSLNKPAVVNLSLGSYLGSHDALDPAGVAIDELLSEKEGRLVVCAAGNSGNEQKYHATNSQINSDTSFIWFKNNPSNYLGANKIVFDLWSDLTESNYFYGFGANLPNGSFEERASTNFYFTQNNLGGIVFDTLLNANGDQLATVRCYPAIVGPNYNLVVIIEDIDSVNYNFSLKTFGTGSYDLWSGEFIGMNQIVEYVPDSLFYPPIVNYVFPDSLQSIVSSWNCSEKVVSVGNLRCRLGHIDKNGNQYYPSVLTTPGKISVTSSRGPNRHGFVKPDICATGEVTLACGPTVMLSNPSFNTRIDEAGLHMRNSGTSMASPVVAGTGALFLEHCTRANWQDFKNQLIQTSDQDSFTGNIPNLTYGNGKLNAFELLKSTTYELAIFGDTVICADSVLIGSFPAMENYFWSNGDSLPTISIFNPGNISLIAEDEMGCQQISDTISISSGIFPNTPIISELNGSLISSYGPNIQWYLNDSELPNDTNQLLFPDQEGYYSVSFTNEFGCSSFSLAFLWEVSGLEKDSIQFFISPNPANNELFIKSDYPINDFLVHNGLGKIIPISIENHTTSIKLDISNLSSGTYFLLINGVHHLRFVKQ